MPRTAADTDVFAAVAEPRRRDVLRLLAGGERSVGELVDELGLAQPAVSKHLRVLREAGAVGAREAGRRRLYHLRPGSLAPIQEWVGQLERLWTERFDRLDTVLAGTQPRRPGTSTPSTVEEDHL